MQSFELEQLLETTLWKYQKQAAEQQIELKIFDDLVNYVFISADIPKLSGLLDQVMHNTLSYANASRIVFSTRQLLRTTTDILLEFSLDHNGHPHSSHRFAYYRSLIACRRLIEELNGKSELHISLSHGSSLKFVIRCGSADNPCQQPGLCSPLLRQKRILVVEDNELNQKSISQMLSGEGLRFAMAGDGKEAIELLEGSAFDLVLMDLHMPRMDGFQTTCFIRKHLRLDIPILGMSGSQHDEYTLKCFEAGVNQFIKKPFSPELLLMQLSSFFEPVYLEMGNQHSLTA